MDSNYDNPRTNGSKTLWIIGGVILFIMIVALVYGATQKSLRIASVPKPVAGVQINSPHSDTSDNSVLGASETVPAAVGITGMDVVNLETVPQQVEAKVSYNVKGTCATLNPPSVSQSGKVFTISLTASTTQSTSCTSQTVPGDVVVDIPVASLSAGTYSIKAGTVVRLFTLAPANQIPAPVSK